MKNPSLLLMFAAIPLLSAGILSREDVTDNAAMARNSAPVNCMPNTLFIPGRWINGTSYEPETVYSSTTDQRTASQIRARKPSGFSTRFVAPASGSAHNQIANSAKRLSWATSRFAETGIPFTFSARNIAEKSNSARACPAPLNSINNAAVFQHLADQKLAEYTQANFAARAHRSSEKTANVAATRAIVVAGARTPRQFPAYYQRASGSVKSRPAGEKDAKVAQQAVEFAQMWVETTIAAMEWEKKAGQPRDEFETGVMENVKALQESASAAKELTFRVKNAGVLK
jgi:hypothetical protein